MNRVRVSQSDCIRFSCSIAPYVDGELDPAHAVDMEAHVIECANCSERVAVLRAIRSSLKRTMPQHRAPEALRKKLEASLANERLHIEVTAQEAPKLIRLRYAAALAMAAVFAFVFALSSDVVRENAEQHSVRTASTAANATVGLDALLDDLVALHANPLPPETTNPDDVERFEPFVGVPVKRAAGRPFDRFRGARLHATHDKRIALMQYNTDKGRRVTVYVFNENAVPLQGARLKQRMFHQQPVYVTNLRGYSIAATGRSGVGVALASDLNDDESADLVLAALNR